MRYGAVLAIALTVAAAVQQPSFKSGANYIRVDVYPTAGGKPVEDLTAAEFELLEDRRPQTIDAFVHILARTSGSTAARGDTAVAPHHRRTFILFLDTAHVSHAGSQRVAEPLIRLLDSIVADGDVIGLMTPDMATSAVQMGSKTDVLVRALREHPEWGRRDDRAMFDETEQRYIACYPTLRREAATGRQMSELAQALIERRRERRALDALNDVVTYLAGVDDTRKTVIAVTEGWVLYGSDQRMLEPRHLDEAKTEPPPGRPGISVGRDGRLTTDDEANLRSSRYPCEADRLALAAVDDQHYLRDIIGRANRQNTSFYTVDPRGLAVFDASVQWDRPAGEALPLTYDGSNLRASHSSMRTLATGTDGLALLDSNDLHAGLRRIAQDLGSYYLLGYYSTNPKPDGKYREITVRVTRPGVQVRARRGYRAPTPEELAAASAPPTSTAGAETARVATAIAELELQLLHRSRAPAGVTRLFHRGPSTANRFVPASTPLFSRTDRIRVERPLDAGAAATGTARLLDRNGQPLPVALSTREGADESGRRVIATELALAPLGAGDYVIEIVAAGETTLTAIRVTR